MALLRPTAFIALGLVTLAGCSPRTGATNAAPTLTGSMMVSTSSIGMRAAALSVAGDSVKAAANLGSQVVAMIMGTKRSVVKSRVDTPYQPTTAWCAIRINIVESTHR